MDCDGPASINNNFTQQGSIGFPSAVMIASTWNQDIVRRFGDSIGTMADEMGVSGWYGPAMNTHRSAFAGRNFEYYSEDSLLSGKMAASAVAGAREHGVYAYLKHFALNDQETNRNNMICTWSNEQSVREIYLKPFELAVKRVQMISADFQSAPIITGEATLPLRWLPPATLLWTCRPEIPCFANCSRPTSFAEPISFVWLMLYNGRDKSEFRGVNDKHVRMV